MGRKKKWQHEELYETGTDGKRYYVKQRFETKRAGIMEPIEANKDVVHEPKCTLYLSMLTSAAWLNLSGGAVRLYHYMKMQAFSNGKNKNKKPDDLDYCHGTEFHFNRSLIAKAYPGLYPSMTQFYKDLKCLVENGFIKVIYKGSFTTCAVYDLSWDWQMVNRKKRDMSKQQRALSERKDKQSSITIYDTTPKTDGSIKNDTSSAIKNDTRKKPKRQNKSQTDV